MSALSKPRAAVIQFPGVNCEYESARALRAAGAEADVLRWNVDSTLLTEYDLFLLPGGFSYQDRIRAGAVAAKERILDAVAEAIELGKPVLGICNGAQVLVEAGFVPGLAGGLELAIAPNRMPDREGYFSDWRFLKSNPESPSWAAALNGSVLPVPFAHGEGRFTSRNEGLFEQLDAAGQIVMRYAKADGSAADGWPVNPNGSVMDVAGICNRAGNVLAMMPHPERCAWLGQVPEMLEGDWGARRQAAMGSWDDLQGPGPGHALFTAMVAAASRRKES
ncbi:MAG: phosphoribosylformylglycinamidine synthase I [bacterium]|nr:phosphoribosylformylglycinamidine synthase I [bacterium]